MPATAIELTREQVLAHRLHAHGLVHRRDTPAEIALLDLGVQNSPPGSLPVALSARCGLPPGSRLRDVPATRCRPRLAAVPPSLAAALAEARGLPGIGAPWPAVVLSSVLI